LEPYRNRLAVRDRFHSHARVIRIVEMSKEDANCLIPYGWTKLADRSRDEV
jgi:hypothetical protein